MSCLRKGSRVCMSNVHTRTYAHKPFTIVEYEPCQAHNAQCPIEVGVGGPAATSCATASQHGPCSCGMNQLAGKLAITRTLHWIDGKSHTFSSQLRLAHHIIQQPLDQVVPTCADHAVHLERGCSALPRKSSFGGSCSFQNVPTCKSMDHHQLPCGCAIREAR